jgi:hypothetical protein
MINQIFNQANAGLDKLMNIVPLPGKVTIIPVKNYAPVPLPIGEPYVAMFNPEQWSEKEKVVYQDDQESGTRHEARQFSRVKSPKLEFEILIDGTGASGEKKEVSKEINKLQKTVGYNGSKHRPNKLFVIWGKFVFQGVFESSDITYTLFRPNGTPLRAKIKLSFVRDVDQLTRQLEADDQSADLTHVRTLRDDERLDQLCNAIYDSPRFLLEVAKANGLTTFRMPMESQTIEFPPIEK